MRPDLFRQLESNLGLDNCGETQVLTVHGPKRVIVVSPSTPAEVSEVLALCAREKVSLVPAGAMSWLDCGNPLSAVDVVLSLNRMRAIIDYSPPDLTLSVQAGLTLKALDDVTYPERQWLPLDPPGVS